MTEGRQAQVESREFSSFLLYHNRLTNMFQDLKNLFGHSMHSFGQLAHSGFGLSRLVGIAKPSTSRRQQALAEVDRQCVHWMNRDLGKLLALHPDTRHLMRHLNLVDHALRHGGLGELEALPRHVLTKALDEIERLVWDWSPVGLAELRSRLAVILKIRRLDDGSRDSGLDAAALPEPVHGAAVTAAEESLFDEMERSWTGYMPATRPPKTTGRQDPKTRAG